MSSRPVSTVHRRRFSEGLLAVSLLAMSLASATLAQAPPRDSGGSDRKGDPYPLDLCPVSGRHDRDHRPSWRPADLRRRLLPMVMGRGQR